ncbi:hypothetical protein ONE63_000538 [Megalurothrips usitatus]|uniref:Uncharacterized protein n=1 Tax=Megalurothrips usitatus TaxID=439358 RepID=A0AAV7Y2R3_9NEOP|nr:hypothetical protein ONE63_000538 [Megalurothrips usitatus]
MLQQQRQGQLLSGPLLDASTKQQQQQQHDEEEVVSSDSDQQQQPPPPAQPRQDGSDSQPGWTVHLAPCGRLFYCK